METNKKPLQHKDIPHDHSKETMDKSILTGNLFAAVLSEKYGEIKGITMEMVKMGGNLCPTAVIMTAIENFVAAEIAAMAATGKEEEAADRILGSIRNKAITLARNPEVIAEKKEWAMQDMAADLQRAGGNVTEGSGSLQ